MAKTTYTFTGVDKVTETLNKIEKNTKAQTKAIGDTLKGLATAAATYFSVDAVKQFTDQAIQKFYTEEKAALRLDATLRAVGGSAGSAFRQFQDLASELEVKTGTADEVFQGVIGTLKTLGRSDAEIVAITRAATDLSVAMGTDVNTAAVQLAQSYNGNVKALGKLFPELKNMTQAQLEAGGATDFFKNRLSGLAEYANSGFAGTAARLQTAMDSFSKQFGELVSRGIAPAEKALTDFFDKLTKGLNDINAFGRVGPQAALDQVLIIERKMREISGLVARGAGGSAFGGSGLLGGGSRASIAGPAEELRNMLRQVGFDLDAFERSHSLVGDPRRYFLDLQTQARGYLDSIKTRARADLAEIQTGVGMAAGVAETLSGPASGASAPAQAFLDPFGVQSLPDTVISEDVLLGFKVAGAKAGSATANGFVKDLAKGVHGLSWDELFARGVEDLQSAFDLGGKFATPIFGFFSAWQDLINQTSQAQIDALEREVTAAEDLYAKQLKTKRELGEKTEQFEAESSERITRMKEEAAAKELELKKRTYYVDKAMKVAGIIQGTAQAVVLALATPPLPLGIALAALVGGLGAAQLGFALAAPEPAFRVGTDRVPYDMRAIVHADEMIVAKPFADAIRSGDLSLSRGGGAGGNSYHVTVNGPAVGSMRDLARAFAYEMGKLQREGRLN